MALKLFRHRAVDPLPGLESNERLLEILELELEKARAIAAILADRARRAENKVNEAAQKTEMERQS